MQAIYRQAGVAIDYTPSSAVDAGEVVVQNNMVGIAKAAITADALGALYTEGIFDVVHDAVVKNAGAAAYWDADGNPVDGTAGTGCFTATSSGNTFAGWFVDAATDSAATAKIKLFGSPSVTVQHYGGLNNLIADPGDGEAIPVTASGRVELVTEGAETRTLAAPTFGGQELQLGMKTDGGNCVVTVTGCDDGDTVTFANTGEVVYLQAVAKAAAYVWRVIGDPDTIVSTA